MLGDVLLVPPTAERGGSIGAVRCGGELSTDTVRVLFVHTATMPPLGADTWVQIQIISELDRARHEVHVACATGPQCAPTPTFAALQGVADVHLVPVNFGVELSSSSGSRLLRAVRGVPLAVAGLFRLARYIRRHDIAIIHTTDRPRDALACVLLARLTRARCVIHCHVGFNPEWMSGALRWSMRRADALVAVSEFVASTLVAGGYRVERVHVVLNAIELEAWTPGLGRVEAREELGYAPEDVVVVTVCRLFPAKGPARLIHAIARVHRMHPQVRLLVVGHEMYAGYAEELEALTRALGVEDIVTFAGRRGDVPALLAASDVFAMPSFLEPFGLVYAEAMAMELPVVALDNGGTPEVVEHGVSGLLSATDDEDALVENLAALAADPTRREELGRHGRQRVERCFTLQRQAGRVADFYRLLAFGPVAPTTNAKDGVS